MASLATHRDPEELESHFSLVFRLEQVSWPVAFRLSPPLAIGAWEGPLGVDPKDSLLPVPRQWLPWDDEQQKWMENFQI